VISRPEIRTIIVEHRPPAVESLPKKSQRNVILIMAHPGSLRAC